MEEHVSKLYYNIIPKKQKIGFLCFLTFLKEEHIYEAYFKNFFKHIGCPINERLVHIDLDVFTRESTYSEKSVNSYINTGFTWDKTKEGFKFWSAINTSFINYMNERYGKLLQ